MEKEEIQFVQKQYLNGEDAIEYVFKKGLEQSQEVIDENGTTRGNSETIEAYKDILELYRRYSKVIERTKQEQERDKVKKTLIKKPAKYFIESGYTSKQLDTIIRKLQYAQKKQKLQDKVRNRIKEHGKLKESKGVNQK